MQNADMNEIVQALTENRYIGESTGKLRRDDVVDVLLQIRTMFVKCYLCSRSDPDRFDEVSALLHEIRVGLSHIMKQVGAEATVDEFIAQLPAIADLLDMDLQAALDGDPAAENKSIIPLAYPGFFAIMTYRVAHALVQLKVPMVPRLMSEYAHSLTGIDINPGAEIGTSFFIDHGTGIVVGETCHIGNNVKIYQGVTLGALSTRKGQQLRGVRRHPTIGDNVTIYAGAVILGGDTVIGNGSTIGGGAFIIESVPPYSKVSTPLPEMHIEEDSKARAKDELFEIPK